MHTETKNLILEVLCNLKTSVFNLLCHARHAPWEEMPSTLRNLVLSLPHEEKERFAEECAFLETMPLSNIPHFIFPYQAIRPMIEADKIPSGVEKGLPYVLHNGKVKLFFLGATSVADMLNKYHVLVDDEGLLGTGCLAKSPHCYQDGDFKVEDGDILLDVGCAEAVFTLDNIDKVSKAYLFEALPEWRKPLLRTFASYSKKVVLVNKLVTDKTTSKSTTLYDAVGVDMRDDAHFFVKMDIEGWERLVIEGNDDFFTSAKVKLSCCVYHRQDDARVIETMLRQKGYKTRFSEGWMLTTMNGIHHPYFRHGVIYAQNY